MCIRPEKPNIKLSDVAGMYDVKEALREDVINPIVRPERYNKFGFPHCGGILLFGPPCTGKTFIAKAIAGEMDAAFFSVSGWQIKDKYVGETEKNMRRLFEAADEYKYSVIFIDEVDALWNRRMAGGNGLSVADFQRLYYIISRKNTLLLLGETQNPWDIDPQVLRPGLFGKCIYVGLPGEEARLAIIKHNLKDIPLDQYISLRKFAQATEGYSAADIKGICERAKKNVVKRIIEDPKQEKTLLYRDLYDSLCSTRPSVSKEQIQYYLDWQKEKYEY